MGRSYNGFSSEERDRVGQRQTRLLRDNPQYRKTSCEACSATTGIVQHLEDYNQPLEGIIGLCHRCHTMIHERFRFPEAFVRYRAAIAAGWRFETPVPAGHWRQVLGDMCWSTKAYQTAVQSGPEVDETWLDTLMLEEQTSLAVG